MSATTETTQSAAATTAEATDPQATLAALEAELAGIQAAIHEREHFGTADEVGALLFRQRVLPGLIRQARRAALADTIARNEALLPAAEAARDAALARARELEAGVTAARQSLATAEALWEGAQADAQEPATLPTLIRRRIDKAREALATLPTA